MTRPIKKLSEAKLFLSICITYSILITVAFLYSFKGSPTFDFIIPLDKIIHTLIYLFLSFLWISYFGKYFNFSKLVPTVVRIMVVCFFYGIIIEVVQELFIPLRKADVFDVLANTIGIILGTLLFWNIKNRIKS